MKTKDENKVAVIGAGPVGIAAAAYLLERGIKPLVLEKGASAGAAMREWGHVRVFTPWKYVTDKTVVKLLENSGWRHPDGEHLPTGREIVREYLKPAAALPEFADSFIYGAEVIAVSRDGLNKTGSSNRDEHGYAIHYKDAAGEHQVLRVAAVIDASGTWSRPNPMGADGLPVPGEIENKARIHYGIPDVLEKHRNDYEGKRILVLGGGHSAINTVLDVLKLQAANQDTRLAWGLRRDNLEKLLGGGLNDELPARGELGLAAKRAIEQNALELLAPFSITRIHKTGDALRVQARVEGVERELEVDRIVVAAGFRPDLNMLRELRLDLDQIVEAPIALAPLIDPNLHSCGTVPPHGVEQLSHHDRNFFIVGMKAYGRAPTFLMMTGYEQVRSIAAELAGDYEAARKVQLVLPETGVCNSTVGEGAGGCCGPAETNAQASSCCAAEPAPVQAATATVASATSTATKTGGCGC